MAVDTAGSDMEDIILSPPISAATTNDKAEKKMMKKNLVVVYEGGAHSELVLKTTNWLEHSGLFKVNVLYVTDKETFLKQEHYLSTEARRGKSHHDNDNNDEQKSVVRELEKEEFLSNIGFEFDKVILTDESERDAQQSARLILGAINALQPDIVVTGASIKKFSIFDNQQYVQLVERLNCPVIIMRDFTIPGMNKVKTALMRLVGRLVVK